MKLSIASPALRATLLMLSLTLFAGAFAVTPQTAQAQTADAPATPAADAPAKPAEATVKTANPYGLDALWRGGDFIARGVLIILLIMSAMTWYVMVVKVIDQTKLMGQAKEADKAFWSANSLGAGNAALKKGTPFWYLADRGIAAKTHHDVTHLKEVDVATWIQLSVGRAVDIVQSRLQGGLSVLATVGSTAPFVGLFGTVWGIYHALTAIGIAGQASIDKVAGPVGEALIMTAIGLAVAVPAVLGYNFLVRRNKAAMEKVRGFSADLQSALLSGTRIDAAGKAA